MRPEVYGDRREGAVMVRRRGPYLRFCGCPEEECRWVADNAGFEGW